jgi:hypothetical protein
VLTLFASLSGCMYYDKVWQPSYPGAKEMGLHSAGSYGGAKALTVQLTSDVALSLSPVFLDRNDSLSIGVRVTPGATLRMVSDHARIETSAEVMTVPLKYQGTLNDIATNDKQGFYQLEGRSKYYSFQLAMPVISGDQFYLVIPIIINPDSDLDMIRVRFDRRNIAALEGTY